MKVELRVTKEELQLVMIDLMTGNLRGDLMIEKLKDGMINLMIISPIETIDLLVGKRTVTISRMTGNRNEKEDLMIINPIAAIDRMIEPRTVTIEQRIEKIDLMIENLKGMIEVMIDKGLTGEKGHDHTIETDPAQVVKYLPVNIEDDRVEMLPV